jgi:hypothetical protein
MQLHLVVSGRNWNRILHLGSESLRRIELIISCTFDIPVPDERISSVVVKVVHGPNVSINVYVVERRVNLASTDANMLKNECGWRSARFLARCSSWNLARNLTGNTTRQDTRVLTRPQAPDCAGTLAWNSTWRLAWTRNSWYTGRLTRRYARCSTGAQARRIARVLASRLTWGSAG